MSTLGEKRVRVEFNPSKVGLVDMIKQQTAQLIDACEHARRTQKPGDPGEINRLWSLAMTAYEEAAMWATKAATADKPPVRPEYPADHPVPGDLGSVPL